MAMPQVAKRWTRAEVLALPEDGQRHELFDGELVVSPTPVPRHQVVAFRLGNQLQSYVQRHGLGFALSLPADLSLDGAQVAQPDVFVLPPLAKIPPSWDDVPNPVLVVEILSPSTARYDRTVKRHHYLRVGIPEYWIVDAAAQVVERWRPGDERPEIVEDAVTWQPRPDLEPLTIDLAELCRDDLR